MHTQVLYEHDSLVIGAKIARSFRLYVPGWTLNNIFKDIETFDKNSFVFNSKLAIYFIDNYPVSVVMYVQPEHQFMAFTRAAYRRNGYAEALVKTILASEQKEYFTKAFSVRGVDGSEIFWKLFENHFPNYNY